MDINDFVRKYPTIDTFVSGEDIKAVTGGGLEKIDADALYTLVQVLCCYGNNDVVKQLKERYK